MPAQAVSIPGAVAATPLLSLGLQEDPLSAFFVLVLAVSGAAISLASIGYVDRYVHSREAALAALFNLFLLSLLLVCVAGTVFLFLVAWEGMTLVSYFLVVHEDHSAEARSAGLTYLVISHGAAAAVLVALLGLSVATGTGQLSAIASGAGGLSPWVRDGVFVAALVGFGTKAGMVPLHVWLPEAHPAAPSNVSALMSGVMIKMGIYGLLRVVWVLLGGGPSWWGYTILLFGAASALVGVLYAIAQHDLKRLLAYHSVENIGIILMGIGASIVLFDLGYPALAALAMAAALLHTWNHALFKSLLFLGAGAAAGATGTRDLEKLGGLVRRMPGIALTFLLGAMAISALPPFNGFVSEWLLFHSLFSAFSTGSPATELVFAGMAAVLALTSGLAAYCFVKAFGIAFLARPRSEAAATAQAPPGTLTAGTGVLAGLCLLLGIAPALAINLASRPLTQMVGTSLGPGTSLSLISSLPAPSTTSAGFAPGIIALLLGLAIAGIWVASRFGVAPKVRVERSWDCGIDAPTARMEYTAGGYSQAVTRIFQEFFRPKEDVERTVAAGTRWDLLTRVRRFSEESVDPLLPSLYRPIRDGFLWSAREVSRLQSGRIHAYLAYMFATLVVLLLVLRFVGSPSP
ncbi:MAG: hydrogenase 4 subunit B [Thermoplasmata archaeon]|nr:hydrogenase 4 subunit B [Thermoplasmata archaeon]